MYLYKQVNEMSITNIYVNLWFSRSLHQIKTLVTLYLEELRSLGHYVHPREISA